MKLIQFTVILSGLIILSSFQFSYSQYTGTPTDQYNQVWDDAVKILLQDHLETNLIPNPNIINDTIKTRITESGLIDVLPPEYYIRIIYDVPEDNKTKHMDLVYYVNFGPLARPHDAKLEKLYEQEYLPPIQIENKKFEEFESYLTGILQHIMCRQGFEKIIKPSDGSAVCVKSTSVEKLIERGWAKP